MKSRLTGLTVSLYLLTLGLGGALLAETAWRSVTQYESDYAIRADLPGGEPLAERVVLIVLDGVRTDAAARMENLEALARVGSNGVAITELPSLSNPGRATLATGAPPEVHGVTNNSRFSPPPVDSLFSLAKEHAVPVTIFGSYFWPRAFGDYIDSEGLHRFDKELGPSPDADRIVDWQQATCDEMLPVAEAAPNGLVILGLTATDEAGHDFGGESEEYARVVQAADTCLGRLIEVLKNDETTIIVTADHGHIHRNGQGGHGGAEAEVVRVPLVLAGRAIAEAEAWEARHLDIAPTIAALAGLPIPANSQGDPIWEALELAPGEREMLEQRLGTQRSLESSGAPSRTELIASGRRARAPLALAVAVLLAVAAGFAVRIGGFSLAAAAAVHLGAYLALYWLLGLGYSLSHVVREEYLDWFFLRNAAAAVAAFLLARQLFRTHSLLLGVVATSLVGLRVAWVWYDAGLLMDRVMLDLSQAFMAYMDLLHNLAVSIAAVLMGAWLGRTQGASPSARNRP